MSIQEYQNPACKSSQFGQLLPLLGQLREYPLYEHLKADVIEIIEKNPSYGYRRIQDALKNEKKTTINHKTLRKLLKYWHLILKSGKSKRPAKAGIDKILDELDDKVNLLRTLHPEEIEPLKVIQADFTEINTFLLVLAPVRYKII